MPTTLSDSTVQVLEAKVFEYLQGNDHITNRELRSLTGITYDQAIYFFNKLLREEKLARIGVASATKYVANKASTKDK